MSEDNTSFLRDRVRDLERENKDLVKDNGGQRDEIRDLKAQLGTAQGKVSELEEKQPAEGSVILNRADAERWAGYQALGKLDDVSAKVKGYDGLEAKDKHREREDGIKALGYKPSVFEVIAQGSSYRAEGEGDDRKVYLTVDDKEVELGERATALGLDDLLGVMGAEVKTSDPKAPTPTGAGTRKPGEFRALGAQERLKEKDKESRYSGM